MILSFLNHYVYAAIVASNFLSNLFFFRYTEHSTVSLAQQWDQLRQMVMRMQHNLEQQIQAR